MFIVSWRGGRGWKDFFLWSVSQFGMLLRRSFVAISQHDQAVSLVDYLSHVVKSHIVLSLQKEVLRSHTAVFIKKNMMVNCPNKCMAGGAFCQACYFLCLASPENTSYWDICRSGNQSTITLGRCTWKPRVTGALFALTKGHWTLAYFLPFTGLKS